MNKNKKKTKIDYSKKNPVKQDFLSYLKKRPFFLGFFIVLIIVIFVLLLTQRQSINDDVMSLTYGKVLHTEHLSGFEYHLSQIEEQLDGDYQTTIEDDYFYSFKEDILWLKQREAEIYNNPKDLFVKQLAFNMAFEGVLIVNENSIYDYYIEDYEERINSALSEKYFDQNFENNFEVKDTFSGEKEKFSIFLNEYNSIMRDYFDYKIFVIKNSNSVERKFVEANKIFILSDPLALS